MLRNTIIATALVTTFVSLPAAAHHFSPAEPDIGDMMEMHESTIDALVEDGIISRDDDMGAPDDMGTDSVLVEETVGDGN